MHHISNMASLLRQRIFHLFLLSQVFLVPLLYITAMKMYGNHSYKVKATEKVKVTTRGKGEVKKMVEDYYDNAPGWEEALELAKQSRRKTLKNVLIKHPDNCEFSCGSRNKLEFQANFSFLDKRFQVTENPFASLHEQPGVKEYCAGKIQIFYNSFAMVHDVAIRPFNWNGTLLEGGRDLYKFKDETLRTDEKEVIKPRVGLFDMYCGQDARTIDVASKSNIDMLKYFRLRSILSGLDDNSSKKNYDYMSGYTVAVVRDIYANMYHMMLHIHNIFLTLLHFHIQPRNLTILLLDAHPKTDIDDVMRTLFGPIVRVTNLRRPIKFENLVLCMRENRSPLSLYSYPTLPYLEEFRKFVLNQYQLKEDAHIMNCSNLHITIIWRRDKVYHPRNLKGSTERKMFNEPEVFDAIYNNFPSACVTGVLLDSIPMAEQLKIIHKTDILIGMHGAGMTHVTFLPKTSGMIELFPKDWRKLHHYYKLFEAIARWRNLRYMFWENQLSLFEMPHYFTVIDTNALVRIVRNMIETLCQTL